MKIAIFTYVFWPEQFLINDLVLELRDRNIEVDVLTGLPNYPSGQIFEGYSLSRGPYREQLAGANIFRYPMIPRQNGFIWLTLNYLSNLVMASFRQFSLKKADWAFVFATSPILTAIPAILWAQLRRARVCLWLQDLWPESVTAVGAMRKGSLPYQLISLVVRYIYRHVDHIMVQNSCFLPNLTEFGYTGSVSVIPNWAPDLDFSNRNPPSWLTHDDQHFLVTYAGNLGKAQGLEAVLLAAKELEGDAQIRFAIVGDGSELNQLKQLSKNLELSNLAFYPRQPLSAMPGLFHASQALLVTLKANPVLDMTVPAKIQAYMAAGRPIVGMLNGAGQDLINSSGAGLGVPATDSNALANAILQLKNTSAEDRNKMGVAGRSYFEQHFTKNKIVEEMIAVLRTAT